MAQAIEWLKLNERVGSETKRIQSIYWLRDAGSSASSASLSLVHIATNQTEDIFVRICALGAISSIGLAPDVRPAMVFEILKNEKEPEKLHLATLNALGSMGANAVGIIPYLHTLIRSENASLQVKEECLRTLSQIPDSTAVSVLIETLHDESLRLAAASGLGDLSIFSLPAFQQLVGILEVTDRSANLSLYDESYKSATRLLARINLDEMTNDELRALNFSVKTLRTLAEKKQFKQHATFLPEVEKRVSDTLAARKDNRDRIMQILIWWAILVILFAAYWVPASQKKPRAVASLLLTTEAMLNIEARGIKVPVGQLISIGTGIAFARLFPKVRRELL